MIQGRDVYYFYLSFLFRNIECLLVFIRNQIRGELHTKISA